MPDRRAGGGSPAVSETVAPNLPEVHVLRWPADEGLRTDLRAAGHSCLLLVDPHDLPPDELAPFEDWVRTTADPIEVHWRTRQLQRLQQRARRSPRVSDCTLVYNDRRTPIPPVDEPLLALLCDRLGQVVTRDELRRAGEAALTDAVLNVRLYRLRRVLGATGLKITTVRGRGCVLEVVHD